MYTNKKPIKFHIELTDKCNALCVQCSRNMIDKSSQFHFACPNINSNMIGLFEPNQISNFIPEEPKNLLKKDSFLNEIRIEN